MLYFSEAKLLVRFEDMCPCSGTRQHSVSRPGNITIFKGCNVGWFKWSIVSCVVFENYLFALLLLYLT